MPPLRGPAIRVGGSLASGIPHIATGRSDFSRFHLPQCGITLWEVASGQERAHCDKERDAIVLTPNDGAMLVRSCDDHAEVLDCRRIFRRHGSPFDYLFDVTLAPQSPKPYTLADRKSRWNMLLSDYGAGAYDALCTLADQPEPTMVWLRQHVSPAPSLADPRVVDQLIADLDSNYFTVRQKAELELERLGSQTEKPLQRTLRNGPTLEVTRRVERLLALLRPEGIAPERVRAARIVELLERMDRPECQGLLERLAAGGDGAPITEEARQSLRRQGRRPVP